MNATIINTENDLKNRIEQGWEQNSELFLTGSSHVDDMKREAMSVFQNLGFPNKKWEKWRETDLRASLSNKYKFFHQEPDKNFDPNKVFTCDVHGLDLPKLFKFNGYFVSNGFDMQFPQGVIICSLKQAIEEHSQLIADNFNKSENVSDSPFYNLNTALFQDGLFIYIPDNIDFKPTLQLIDLVIGNEGMMINSRNLIVLGKNSSLSMIYCEESVNMLPGFINSVSEIVVGENSTVDLCRILNKDDETTVVSSIYVNQSRDSNFKTSSFCFNGGTIRNEVHTDLNGENANTDISGLYIMGKSHHVDNQVVVNHNKPHCTSNQLYKGVLDDQASGVFNGYINVKKNAYQTNGMQTNRNILLSEKAKMHTRPFLEIYNDDVKCSHGATVGQLDPMAMFYLRTRGISPENANILLLYAFVVEVVNKIAEPTLFNQIDDMVKKRLRGELAMCNQCVLNCSKHENESKLLQFLSQM
ncbi:MAG: Fe-S cluster assembly protein SufD [Bacteroidales bacterium]